MIRIDTHFPGGNGHVHNFDGTTFWVSPDLRDTTTSWFYWAFRLQNVECFWGKTLQFRFVAHRPVGVRGAAISCDGRRTWGWSEAETFGEDYFTYTIPEGTEEIYLAFAPLYTQREWDTFLASLPCGSIQEGVITTSRKGRKVELLHIGKEAGEAFHHLIFTARHHCCEMIANYTMEGIISTILLDESMEATYLRDHASFSFVPFVDKDGVEDGDQGKNRYPHDHARDYGGETAIYSETKAVTKVIQSLLRRYGKVDLVMDMHCPWIRSGDNELVYLVGKESEGDPVFRAEFGKFIEAYKAEDALPYSCDNDIPYGKSWNTAANYTQGMPLNAFCSKVGGVQNSTSIEIPYANAQGTVVLPETARALGRGIAFAVARYLMEK